MWRVLAICLGTVLACLAGAQTARQLLGKAVRGDEPSPVPVANARVVLDESGSHDVSDSDGLFHLYLPDVLRPGDEVTVTVTVPGYAVFEPPGGKLRIPAEPARTQVRIQLLAKGSPKFLADAQLRALVERAAKDSVRQPTPPGAKEAPDLEHYLKDWGEQHGINPGQVREQVDRWAERLTSANASPYDLSLAAFAIRNFREAHDRALDAAREDEARLEKLQKEAEEGRDRLIRDYALAGDAAYNNLDFEQASSAYANALARASRDQNGGQWAALQLQIGNSEESLISRSEGAAIERHVESAKKAYQAAFEVYTREQLPWEWATTQNNLGNLLRDLGLRSEGAQGAAYLEQSVAAYRNALQVYIREQLPQQWAMTQNNLGNVLSDLGERSGGRRARPTWSNRSPPIAAHSRSIPASNCRRAGPRPRTTWVLCFAIWGCGARGRGARPTWSNP